MKTYYPAIDETVRAIVSLKLATEDEIVGCTPEQIGEAEERYHLTLPKIYREYLSILGRAAGRYSVGIASGYPAILELGEKARALMDADEAIITLPENAFVFSMYQGFQFKFFLVDELNDDPAVYLYSELSNKFVKETESFSQHLRKIIEQLHVIANRKWFFPYTRPSRKLSKALST